MTDQGFLSARIDADGGPEAPANHARVPWWSFTKTALATAALQLVGRGHFRLDERIDSRPFTLRQLLQHRAGVPSYGGLACYHEAVRRGEKPWEIGQLLDRVVADRLDFDPGHGWRYSNVGYLLVRQLIEETVGRDIGSALRYLVFDSLGLESVRMAASAEDLAHTAWGNRTGYDPRWVYHGLLIGTPGDAVRFLHSLMSGDVLPRELLTEMTARHPISDQSLSGRPWETTAYGLGIMIGRMASAGIAMGHSGAGPGSVSAVYHFADRPTPCTVAAFASGDQEGATEHEVVRLVQLR
ncbi:MAG TPA: serine hydrolase domain-containing protein [Xanthobacteraceae bacterium]|jgi:CubicO group peptidase (beta-lactamase class C family)